MNRAYAVDGEDTRETGGPHGDSDPAESTSKCGQGLRFANAETGSSLGNDPRNCGVIGNSTDGTSGRQWPLATMPQSSPTNTKESPATSPAAWRASAPGRQAERLGVWQQLCDLSPA